MNTKKIMISGVLGLTVLMSAGTIFAQGGGQGNRGGGGGCHGDATCQAERQANGGNRSGQDSDKEKRDYDHEERDENLDDLKNSPLQEMSETDKEHIAHMREEEKIARDVYIKLYEKWGVRSFDNIQKSETKHMDAVKILIDKYGLEDSMKSNDIGVFNNPAFQKLYDDLMEKGLKSKIDALQVAMTIEDVDIYDLEKFMLETSNTDILKVFDNLNEGSKNHMRAFYRQLERENGAYSAQFITESRMQEILSGSDDRQGKGDADRKGNDNSDDRKGGNRFQNSDAQNTVVAENNQAQERGFFARMWNWMAFWR